MTISIVSDGKGNCYYFDLEQREKILAGELDYYADSHTSIADFHGFKGVAEDNLNKYSYNPFSRQFEIDQLNTVDDSKQVEVFCNSLDFENIIPLLDLKIYEAPRYQW